jgi:hypothetical protein
LQFVDNLIIGGGLFGIYAAEIAPKDETTLLVEKEKGLMLRASSVNQARLHSGLHYLRSARTAQTSQFYFQRFLEDHKSLVNGNFAHLYLVDKHRSLSGPKALLRVADNIGTKVQELDTHAHIDTTRVSGIFKVNEPTIDLEMLRDSYVKKAQNLGENLLLNSEVLEFAHLEHGILVTIKTDNEIREFIVKRRIVIAAYSGLNSILEKLQVSPETMSFELSEIIYGQSDLLENLAITVMDGQHVSAMPYGFSGLSTVTSVKYSHRAEADANSLFVCQVLHGKCRPSSFFNCGNCQYSPTSAAPFIVNQLQRYFTSDLNFGVHANKYEVKAFWNASPGFDHRFTAIRRYSPNNSKIQIYGVLSGKLSSIYELESIYD